MFVLNKKRKTFKSCFPLKLNHINYSLKCFLLQSILTIWILTYHDFKTNQYFRDVELNPTIENIVR